MKIAFDLTPIFDHLTGVERYNLNITREIIRNHPENEYILLFKNEIHKEFLEIVNLSNITYLIIPSCNKLIFIQIRLLKALNEIQADYYLFLSFTSPVLFRKEKIVNAIHDLTCWDCPESIPTKMKYYYRLTYKVAAKRSWRLVTVSKYSQGKICDRYGLSKDRVPIIYDGLTDIFRQEQNINAQLKEKYNLPDKYILSLSTIEPRKNLKLLIKAYREMFEMGIALPDLVLAGRQGWKLEDIIGDISEEIKKRVHFTGFIDDQDLPQLYREAELFIFPSKYEGFGLPLIEAMSQGTLVLSSDAASLPEVSNNAGILFKSDDINDLIRVLIAGLNIDQKERERRIEFGKIISRSFSWENEAERLYSILKDEYIEV